MHNSYFFLNQVKKKKKKEKTNLEAKMVAYKTLKQAIITIV